MEIYKNYLKEFMYIHQELKSIYIKELKSLPKEYFIDKLSLHGFYQSKQIDPKIADKLIIAEILYMYNIAFRYEQRLYINGRRFAPDFKIFLPDGSIFYWEHVGLTNDKWYMHDHYDKLKHYQYKDIVPWKNLILTYDNELGDLNTQIIHSEIKNKLLPHF